MFVVSVGLKHQSSFEETLCGEVIESRSNSFFTRLVHLYIYLRIRKMSTVRYYFSFLARLRMNESQSSFRSSCRERAEDKPGKKKKEVSTTRVFVSDREVKEGIKTLQGEQGGKTTTRYCCIDGWKGTTGIAVEGE